MTTQEIAARIFICKIKGKGYLNQENTEDLAERSFEAAKIFEKVADNQSVSRQTNPSTPTMGALCG